MFLNSTTDKEDIQFLTDLYQKLSPKLFKWAFSLTQHEANSYDLVQDTFLILMQKLELIKTMTFQEISNYAMVILKHKAFKINKDNNAVNFDLLNMESTDNIEIDVLKSLDLETLNKCILKMPDRYRDFLSLKYYSEFDNKTIAETLDIQVNSVRMIKTRALRLLKEIFLKEGGE